MNADDLMTVLKPGPGLDILNTGSGHVEMRFDKDPMELERAKRIITDMLKRGYVLFVEGKDKELHRVEKFDPEKMVYLIADLSEAPATVPASEVGFAAPTTKRRGRPRKAVAVAEVRTTAIGRSAGG